MKVRLKRVELRDGDILPIDIKPENRLAMTFTDDYVILWWTEEIKEDMDGLV